MIPSSKKNPETGKPSRHAGSRTARETTRHEMAVYKNKIGTAPTLRILSDLTNCARIGYFSKLFRQQSLSTHPHMASSSKKPLSFEAAMSELEAIVNSMEAGKLPLDESLAKYQRGIELLRECNGTLRAAEQKIAILEADGLRDITPGELASGMTNTENPT